MAKSYQELWEKQKKNNPFLTLSNASTAAKPTPTKPSGGNIVSGASADLGAGKAEPQPPTKPSGGTKKKQPVIEDTLEERISAYTPAATTKKNPDTGGYDWQSAVKAATDSANKQKEDKALLTRDYTRVNYTPYLDDETEDRTTDISSDAKNIYTAPNAGYSLPATDPGINYDTINMLLNRYGIQPVNGKIGGVPVEALYLGDNQYAFPYLLDNSDSQQMYSNGNLITVGDYKKALMDGFLKSGNEAAYNDWIAGVAQNPNVKTLSAYEYEEPTAYEESGESDAYRDYIDAAVEAILGQKSGIDQEAAAAKQLAYENYMRTKLGLGEQTSGMATGTADSLMMQNDLTLQNNLTGIDQDRLNAYADIDSQAAQMEAEGNLQLAQMAEERRREAEERARQEREWAYQLEQDRIKNANSGESYSTESETTPIYLTARGYVDSNYGRTDFANLTLENIQKELNELKKSGVMTTEEYNKALEYYQGLRSLENL